MSLSKEAWGSLQNLAVMIVVGLLLALLLGCGGKKSPNGPESTTISVLSDDNPPTRAAKLAVAENSETVIICHLFGTYPTNSDVWVSRAISGRAPDWKVGRWDSKHRAVFNVDAGGYYRAIAVGPDDQPLGDEWQWSSIPIRAGEVNMFDLTAGQQAKKVIDWRIDEEVSQPQLTVLVSRTLSSLDVVAGTVGFNFAFFTFDATAAREDIVVRSFHSLFRVNTLGTMDDIHTLKLLDGSTVLNALNIVNPPDILEVKDWYIRFVLDEGIRIPKGTVKTIPLKGGVRANPDGIPDESTYAWGFKDFPGNVDAVGATSGLPVPVHVVEGPGAEIRLRSHGVLKIAFDPSTFTDSSVKGGSVDVLMLKLKFSALYENILHSKIRIRAVGNPKAILKLTFWDEYGSKLGEGVFAGNNDYADSTWNLRLLINRDGSRVVTVTADLSPLGLGYSAKAGDTISLMWENTGHLGEETWGVGESSGAKIFSNPIPPSASDSFWGRVLTLM